MRRIIFQVMLSALVAVLLTVLSVTAEATELQWFGQSAFKITTPGGKIILVDPFITKNPKTPEKFKDLKKLGKVDLILVTHGHGDHIGDTAQIAKMTNAKVALNADMGHTFVSLGWVSYKQMVRFNKSGPVRPIGSDITITMVHAEHSSEVLYKTLRPTRKRYIQEENLRAILSSWKMALRFTMQVIRGSSLTWSLLASITNQTLPSCQLADTSPWTRNMLPMLLGIF